MWHTAAHLQQKLTSHLMLNILPSCIQHQLTRYTSCDVLSIAKVPPLALKTLKKAGADESKGGGGSDLAPCRKWVEANITGTFFFG